jgi:hypothetical protein
VSLRHCCNASVKKKANHEYSEPDQVILRFACETRDLRHAHSYTKNNRFLRNYACPSQIR